MPDAAVHLSSGKVREIYAVDEDTILLVASDRISTFDVVLPTPIPDKGRVLTGLSAFWFARTHAIVPNHLRALGDDGRSTTCTRLEMLPVEFVVRGYLAGSAHRRDLYYAARALDNTMYVVFANAVGGADPWRFNGGAAVYDPEGRPLVRGADDGEAVPVASLDPAALAATRSAHSMLADRPDAPANGRASRVLAVRKALLKPASARRVGCR